MEYVSSSASMFSLCLRSAYISLALILKGFSTIKSYVSLCVILNMQEEQICAENT